MKYIFYPSSKVWPEIISLLEAVVQRWSSVAHQQLAGDWKFYGNYCKCLVAKNKDHLYGLTMGQNLLICNFEEWSMPASTRRGVDDTDFIPQMQVSFGNAFEKMLPQIEEKWGEVRKHRRNWPGFYDFCYHIRNGAFHGNKFNIYSNIYQDTQWRDAIITKKLNGEHVMVSTVDFLASPM